MSVEVGLAEAGKVFGRADDAGRAQSLEKFPGIKDRLFRVRRNRTGTHDRPGGLEGQVHHRRKVSVESQGPAGFANDFAVFAEELAVAGGENVGGGRA